MGNLIELPNITLDSLTINTGNDKKPEKNGTFDEKNYLDTRLKEGETKKVIYFRPLPMNLETGSPFEVVHFHNVPVPKSMVQDYKKAAMPHKSYICLSDKNANIDHETFGHKCPFCEINRQAYADAEKETDPDKKKDLYKISCANMSKPGIIMRGIVRGQEADGVKFWKFNLRDDGSDPYHQIVDLVESRKEEGAVYGKNINILDIYNGRDLKITITAPAGKETSTVPPKIVDVTESSPLSQDEEQMRAWIYDSKKWQEVFTCKPYDFLSLISEMKHPWKNKKTGQWVDKAVFEAQWAERVSGDTREIQNAEQKVAEMAKEASKTAEPIKSQISEEDKRFLSGMTLSDSENDDMPF